VGRSFMTYGKAQARLRKAVTRVITGGPAAIVADVFDA